MIYIITLVSTSLVSFLSHNWVESLLTRNGTKNIRLIIRRRHIHHSVYGLAAVAAAVIFTGGFLMIILLGYGIGNIWQHKLTHNRVNEPGMVFVSKLK